MTFDQAQAAARAWARAQAEGERQAIIAEAAPTVREAVNAYIAARKARGGKDNDDAGLRLSHHVLSAPIADKPLGSLTDEDFAAWRAGLTRGGRGDRSNGPALAPGTLARLLNDLRAALRAAIAKARLPADAMAVVTAGCAKPADATRPRAKQVLPDADIRRIVAAAQAQDEDFADLVLVLAATGARFDQVARLTVADFQPDRARLMVPVSRKGRGAKALAAIAVPLPDDVVLRLRRVAAGRAGHEPLLMRWHHRQRPGARQFEWERVERRSWADAAEMTRQWRRALAAAGMPGNLVPYCLRHSSIVRGLRAGLPVRLVAAAHDTSVAMIERHYGAFVVDATEDLLRRALVPMTTAKPARLKAVR
jgi:integrase